MGFVKTLDSHSALKTVYGEISRGISSPEKSCIQRDHCLCCTVLFKQSISLTNPPQGFNVFPQTAAVWKIQLYCMLRNELIKNQAIPSWNFGFLQTWEIILANKQPAVAEMRRSKVTTSLKRDTSLIFFLSSHMIEKNFKELFAYHFSLSGGVV